MHKLHRPSPALAISLLALFVALGGTSYAALSIPANSVGSKQLKKNAVTSKKIKNHAVTASKINTTGLTVPHATSARPVAYAHVLSNGALDTARSKNVTAVSETTAGTGFYCIKVRVPVSGLVATVDAGNSASGQYGFANGVLRGQDPSNYIGRVCPSGTSALVGTANHSGQNAAEPFWIAFF